MISSDALNEYVEYLFDTYYCKYTNQQHKDHDFEMIYWNLANFIGRYGTWSWKEFSEWEVAMCGFMFPSRLHPFHIHEPCKKMMSDIEQFMLKHGYEFAYANLDSQKAQKLQDMVGAIARKFTKREIKDYFDYEERVNDHDGRNNGALLRNSKQFVEYRAISVAGLNYVIQTLIHYRRQCFFIGVTRDPRPLAEDLARLFDWRGQDYVVAEIKRIIADELMV